MSDLRALSDSTEVKAIRYSYLPILVMNLPTSVVGRQVGSYLGTEVGTYIPAVIEFLQT